MKTYSSKANAKRAAKNQGLDLNTTCIFEQDGLWVIGQVDLFDEAEADLNKFDKLIDEEENKLIAEGLITVSEEKAFKFFKYKKHSVTEDLNQQALELAGLKKFLLDSLNDSYNAKNTNFTKYNNLKIFILPAKNRMQKGNIE